MDDLLVTVCNCSNIGDAQAIRASLEARGVPTLIDGEHQRNMLGMFGTVVALRIMVPRSQLRLAYELAREIIEDLPEPSFDDEDQGEVAPREPMPQRRALPEDLVAYPDDDEQGDELDHELDDDDEFDDDIDERRDQPTLFVPRVSFGLGMAVAIGQLAFGYITQGLIAAAILVGLVYLRVLPLTSNEPK